MFGQDILPFGRMDLDSYLNGANTTLDSSYVRIKYQDDHPDIPNSFNTIIGEVNGKLPEHNFISMCFYKNFITKNTDFSGMRLTYAKQINVKQLQISLSVGGVYMTYKNSIDPELYALNESPHNRTVTNVDFPLGGNLKYNFRDSDSVHIGYLKAGYFMINSLEPDMAFISPGTVPNYRIHGISFTASKKWSYKSAALRTDLYHTSVWNVEHGIAQTGWEQAFGVNNQKSEIGYNIDYFSNNTLGFGVNYTIANIKAKISKGIPTMSPDVKMANPYYLMSLYYSF